MATIDEIAPDYVGSKRIKVELADPTSPARAFGAIDMNVTIDAVADGDGTAERVGLSTPLVMTITSPTPSNFERQVFNRTIPAQVSFTPREGGPHLVTLRELAHNRFWGSLVIDVAGDRLDPDAES